MCLEACIYKLFCDIVVNKYSGAGQVALETQRHPLIRIIALFQNIVHT